MHALRYQDIAIRRSAIQALDRLGWQPDALNTEFTIAADFYTLKEKWDKCIEIGDLAVESLISVMRIPSLHDGAVYAIKQIKSRIAPVGHLGLYPYAMIFYPSIGDSEPTEGQALKIVKEAYPTPLGVRLTALIGYSNGLIPKEMNDWIFLEAKVTCPETCQPFNVEISNTTYQTVNIAYGSRYLPMVIGIAILQFALLG